MNLGVLACIVLHNICINRKDNLPAELDLTTDPFTLKKRTREEIRDLLQMRNCYKQNDSSRLAGAIRETLTNKLWEEKGQALEM